MTQQNQMVAANAAQPKPIDLLKTKLNADSVQEQFKNALGKNANTFIASIIDLYNGDSKLQQCKPGQVIAECLKAAVLHLPINKALGYAYVIPFNNTVKDAWGKTVKDEKGYPMKRMEPVFQLGYKGYVQLAMRTGQYKILNADVVYNGELDFHNKLTGETTFNGVKKSDDVIGYFCYFRLVNGFEKVLYMSVEQMAKHAFKYSKGLKRGTTVDTLLEESKTPVDTENSGVGWIGNFHSMALKTVIRLLLSKYGYLSIEMQNAFASEVEADVPEVMEAGDPRVKAAEPADFEEIGEEPQQAALEKQEEPAEEPMPY